MHSDNAACMAQLKFPPDVATFHVSFTSTFFLSFVTENYRYIMHQHQHQQQSYTSIWFGSTWISRFRSLSALPPHLSLFLSLFFSVVQLGWSVQRCKQFWNFRNFHLKFILTEVVGVTLFLSLSFFLPTHSCLSTHSGDKLTLVDTNVER